MSNKNPFLLTKNDILDAFNSIVNSDELRAIENLQSNLNFLSSRNSNSNALDALQGYGVTARSPSWNISQNIEPSSTPNSSTSCKPFSNLNLNSVEEEDEFLYGDSNSVPEEQVSVKEESIINTAGRLDSGWSDEEDPYGDPRPLSKLNSRLRKNLSECESQNKFQENVNYPHTKREENRIQTNAPSREISAQKYASHKLQSDDSAVPSGIEKSNFSEISSTSVGNKSKYHAAAEVLKKRTVEKSNVINSSSSEKLGIFPGTSKNSSELDKSLHSDLKTDKLANKKQVPRTINKRHIDNIREYIAGVPQRKRAYPDEDFPTEKHQRYETSRTSSYSPSRRHSPNRPPLPSHKPRSSYASESDRVRYASSYSRPRSPSFESEKHHSRYSENRRYSPSPKRWSRSPDYRHRRSREKSSDYSRHKDRSPRSRRSRSRSPGYYSSRNKTYDKKRRSKSPKKTDYYPKKKEKYSSGDSYCSLSLGSSSSSSSTSSDSSDEKKSSRKSPAKTVPKHSRKLEDEVANLKTSTDTHLKKSDSAFPTDDLSKKLSDIFSVKGNDGSSNLQLDPESINQLLNASLPNREQQLIMNFLEHQMQPQQQPIVVSDSSTYTSPSISGINIPSNVQMISPSDSYAYPSVPAAPVQYVAPPMPNFPSMIPSAAYPAPVMTAHPSPAEYGPYLTVPPVQANDSQYVTNVVTNTKSGKTLRPPATLRTIPVSDNLHVSPSSSSNITVVPSNFSQQKISTIPKIQESKPSSSLKSVKQSLENKAKSLKEKKDEKNVSSSSNLTSESAASKVVAESTSEKNKLLIIDKFKRLKAERTNAQKRARSATEDLDEMRKMLDETFGRKPSPSDKMLYSKCKNQFNLALDRASQNNKLARRSDENLNNFKARLPTALQTEVSKIKFEHHIEEPTNEIITCLDQGDHLCCDCCISFNDIKEVLNHIKTPEHKEQMETNMQEWKKDFVKEQKDNQNNDQKKTVLKPVKGAEFLKPLTGFYCSLCKRVFIEEAEAEKHVKGHQHYTNYDNFMKVSPLYERKRLFKQYIKMAVVAKQKRLKASEDKDQQLADQLKTKQLADQLKTKQLAEHLKMQETAEKKKKQQAEQQKMQETADKKTKEIVLKEKSREIKFEELEENESEDVYLSSSQKSANIKLNLSDKDKSFDKKNASKESESKNSTKYVFIGKAPNFKKTPSQKPASPKTKPWYKRENILNKKESDDVLSSPSLPYPFPTKKSLSPEVKTSNDVLKSKETLNLDSSLRSNRQASRFESEDSNIKKNVKDKLTTPDSSTYKPVKLSEIKLPEVSSLPSSSNANIPQPMDIDNSQATQDKPKSEEEKDFLLLGIKREDFQPLVIPVPPPPTSMVSYPNLSNVQTFTSDNSSSTTSTSIIKNLDLSVPPPTIAPYQNSAPPMPVYGNQSNTQNMGPYSYPTNNPPLPAYSNSTQINMQTNFQTMPQFSTPPPAFRNPPPMLPYSNTGNMQPHQSQFSNISNLPPYNTYSNSVPSNLSNQAYQPPAFSMPPKNQTQFPAPQSLPPPGSEYDTSFHNKNFKSVTAAPTYTQTSKISPFSLQKVGNLTIIVPEKKTSESVSDNKPVRTPVKVQGTNEKCAPGDVNKNIKNVIERKQTEMTSNAVTIKSNILQTAKVVGVKDNSNTTSKGNEKMNEQCLKKQCQTVKAVGVKDNSNTTSKGNEKMNEQCLKKGAIKCITDESIKKVNLEETVKSSNVSTNIEGKKSYSCSDKNIIEGTEELLKVNKKSLQNSNLIPVPLGDSVESNRHEISNIENKDDSKATLEQNTENVTSDSAVLKNEQKNSENSDHHEISNSENKNDSKTTLENSTENVTSDSAVVEKEQKNSKNLAHHEISNIENKNDSKTTLEQNTKNVTSDSVVLENEQKSSGNLSHHEISNVENKNGSKTTLNQSTENITNDFTILENEQKNFENPNCHEVSNGENKNDSKSKTSLEQSTENVTKDSTVLGNEQNSDHHGISNVEIENRNDSEETDIKLCNKQISSEDMEIKGSTFEKLSNDFCSSSGNSGKTDEAAEYTKSTEVTVTNKETEKIIEKSILENNNALKQSNESETNNFAVLKNEHKYSNDTGEISFEIFKVNIEKEGGKLMDTDDDSEKSSVYHSFSAENSSKEVNEKCEDAEMPNLSTENSSSNINEKNEDTEMPDLNTIIKEGSMSDLCCELSCDIIENKNNKNDSEETTIMEICENIIPDESMEVDDRTVLEKPSNNFNPLGDSSGNNDLVTEVRENKELAKTINDNAKIFESSIQDSEAVLKENFENVISDFVSSEQKEVNVNYANESSCDETSDVNREKVFEKLIQEINNVTSEKFIEGCLQEENSSCKINEKSEIVEMLNVNKIVEDKNVDDSSSDENFQNKNIKNDVILSGDIVDILEGNGESFLINTDVSSMSVSNVLNSTLTDVPMNNEICELSMSKSEEEISGQNFKSDSCLAVKSGDNSQSLSSNVTEKETDIEKIFERNASVFISLEDITACNDKNRKELDSSELYVSSNSDANESNQIAAVEQEKLEIEDPLPKKESCKKSVSKTQKRKPSKFQEPAAAEPMRGRPLRSCRLRSKGQSSPSLEGSEVSTPVIQAVSQEEEDKDQKLDESHEDSEILEDEKKTLQSDSQTKKKKGRKQKGKKKKALPESETDVKEETGPVSESSGMTSGKKDSSDTEEYDDDDEAIEED